MSAETPKRECPCCQSTNLKDGKLSVNKHRFIPEGQWMWLGYTPKTFVCLECGFMGHYLTKADISDLLSGQS
jgi:hypothetical protein